MTTLFLLTASLTAQGATPATAVVPHESYASSPGTSGGRIWGWNPPTPGWRRAQYIYDTTTLTDQGVNGPIRITRLRYREKPGVAQNNGQNSTHAKVQMSSGSVDYLDMTSVFADNHGSDVTTVYEGTPTLAPSTGSTPNNWCVDVVLDTPFLYDPSSGRDLVIDIDRLLTNAPTWFGDGTYGSHMQGKGSFFWADSSGPGTPAGFAGVVINASEVCELTFEVLSPPPVPDILNYQFNEVRGTEVANVASSNTFPVTGTANQSNWQTDSDRARFRGNEPGFGALSHRTSNPGNSIDTNAPLQHAGSITYMWWQRRRVAGGNMHDAMGGGEFSGGNFTWAGVGFQALLKLEYASRFGPTADVYQSSRPFSSQLGIWQHACIVIDNDDLTCSFYIDGEPAGTSSFANHGSHSFPPMQSFHVGSAGLPNVGYTKRYDMDEFRIYGRALTHAEVFAVVRSTEHASASATGPACSTGTNQPQIAAFGSRPTSGNANFGVKLEDLTPGQPVMILLGLEPASIPMIDLDFLLGGPGCFLQVPPITWAFGVPFGSSFLTSLPIPNGFAGSHIYAQGLQNTGGGTGSMTGLLDINIQDF